MKNNATKKQPSANATKKPSSAKPEQQLDHPEQTMTGNWLKFSAKCGPVERSLTFPIKPEFEDWLWELYALYGEPDTDPRASFELEGNAKMKFSLSIVNFKQNF